MSESDLSPAGPIPPAIPMRRHPNGSIAKSGRGFYAISLLLAALGFLFSQSHSQRNPSASSSRQVLYYVDPMHPAYRSEKPGIAPDCGMQLEPVYAEKVGKSIVATTAQTVPELMSVDSNTQQLLGIRVAAVERTARARTLRIPGRVTADETRIYRIDAAVDGFVRETHDDTVGSSVKKGQRLAVVYSHEFLSAAGGYLSVIARTQDGTGREVSTGTKSSSEIQSWADRLRNLGMSEAQLRELSATNKIPEGVDIVSPADGFIVARNVSAGLRFDRNMEFYRIADLTSVWIEADLFGSEGRYLHPGTVAHVTLRDQNKGLSARVSDILPQVDPVTRTVKLRLEANNKTLILRPNMLVNVDFILPAPSGLSVPTDAVVDSGLSQRVYVESDNGLFEPREVETGERFGDRVQILRGLAEGEKVVASGTFLVDSESRLRRVSVNERPGPTSRDRNDGSKMREEGQAIVVENTGATHLQ